MVFMLTAEQTDFLNKFCRGRWINDNDVISVEGSVRLSHEKLTQIPVQFGNIKGIFDCSSNQLTSLKGGPKEVSESYVCSFNQLTSLKWAPEICNINFYCHSNLLTSLEGCPIVIKGFLHCGNNPDLEYLWGIGQIEDTVYYDDNENEINKWIIECMQKDIIFPSYTLEENVQWIKREQMYSILLSAPDEIRKWFSPRILNLVDSGVYNESKILDYKKFSSLC